MRGRVQRLIQESLEEITEFLGRARSARWSPLQSDPGQRNGYGKLREADFGQWHSARVAAGSQYGGAVRESGPFPIHAVV